MTGVLTHLARRWGAREGTIARIDATTSLVARFESDAGRFYVRVTTAAVRPVRGVAGAVDWQRHLFNAGAPVTEPIASLNGSWIETSNIGPETFLATVTRAAPGRPVDFGKLPEVATWAEAVGRVHAASTRYAPGPVLTNAGPIRGELPTLPDQWNEIAPIVAGDSHLRGQYARGSEFLTRLSAPVLVTHSDARPANALISDGRVTLLDFDEPTWAWAPCDLARMMLDDDARPPLDRGQHWAALQEGYRRGNPELAIDDDVEQFLLLRILLMYAWSLQDSDDPNGPWMQQLRSLALNL